VGCQLPLKKSDSFRRVWLSKRPETNARVRPRFRIHRQPKGPFKNSNKPDILRGRIYIQPRISWMGTDKAEKSRGQFAAQMKKRF
jgi:hypothetical protein